MTDKKHTAEKTKAPEIEAEKDAVLPESGPERNTGEDNRLIERGGPKGPEPTRFGDWENNGRCTDF